VKEANVAALTAKAQKGREKALRRATRTLEGLWRALGIPGPPPLEAAEFLTQRGKPMAEVRPHRGKQAEVSMFFPVEILHFPTSLSTFPLVRLEGGADGDLEVEVKGIFAREGKAFFAEQHLWEVTEAREAVRILHPLFAALGLADLEEALEVLSGLGEGEARREGEYLLAREVGMGARFVLRRGGFLGDLALDKAFVLGKGVRLSYPGGVELVLQGWGFEGGLAYLRKLEIRWGEEKVDVGAFRAGLRWAEAQANGDDPVGELVRKAVKWELREPALSLSPRMRVLLETLAKQKRPLRVLGREGFLRKVLLDALSRV
jgi:hypothetical protein